MALSAPDTIYTKTAKGVLEIKNKSVKLSRELGLVFLSIDGKASIADLQPRSGMTPAQLQHALQTLVTDGYIRIVSNPAQQQSAPTGDEVDFTQKQAIASVNAEAASRALAAADAAKRAQLEGKAALEARLRQEAEARARALAEARADSEAQARAKAEEAARAAAEERSRAEAEASNASDAAVRAEAEARARAAAAATVRASAEARVRAEAEERARALAETKRAAEEEAGREAEARAKAENQAQARAAAEGRAREVLEAQLEAMRGVAAHVGAPDADEAEAARARVRKLENEAERAREAARASAEAEGRADDIPQPEMDIADRVRQLNARVAAARSERADASKHDTLTVDFAPEPAKPEAGETWPMLQLGAAATSAKPPDDLPMVSIPSDDEPVPARRQESAPAQTPGGSPELPVVDFNRAPTLVHPTPEHVPTALERAMAEVAARAQARAKEGGAAEPRLAEPAPAPAEPAPTPPEPPAHAAEAGPADKIVPTIDDEEPIVERLNIDRASHDIIAETVAARRAAEAAQLTRDAIDSRRRRVEEDTRRAAVAERQTRRKKLLQGLAVAAVVLPALVVAWLQFATLNGYIPAAQNALSQRLNQPVAIQSLRYVLLPTPRLVLEGVWIGKGQGVKVKRVEAPVNPFAALAGPASFGTVRVEGVDIDAAILGTIPKWTGGRPAEALHVNKLRFTELKLGLPGADLGTFEGNIAFASNGTVKEATFNNGKATLALTPQPEGVRVALDATGWRIPYGPPIEFDRLKLNGLIDQGQIAAGEFTGTLAAGSIEGAVTARWAGPISVQGEFRLQNARVLDLTRELTPNFSARGTLKANGRFAMQGADWNALLVKPQVESTFSIARGELSNIDVLRAIQSAAPGAMRGGKTSFEDLSGVVQVAGGHYVFRQLQLTSGALSATGAVDVNAQGLLSGRFSAQIDARGGVVARSSLGVSGTVQDPQLGR